MFWTVHLSLNFGLVDYTLWRSCRLVGILVLNRISDSLFEHIHFNCVATLELLMLWNIALFVLYYSNAVYCMVQYKRDGAMESTAYNLAAKEFISWVIRPLRILVSYCMAIQGGSLNSPNEMKCCWFNHNHVLNLLNSFWKEVYVSSNMWLHSQRANTQTDR